MSKLREIFEHKKVEVDQARHAVPLAELLSQIRENPPPKGFRRALEESPHAPSLIAEVKKASPSQGLIRADFDPVAIAAAYQSAGAACLSVLTDEKYFAGSPDNLRRVRESSALPILRKDFIFDPYQVYEARAWGADAVLLIAAGLTREALHVLHDISREAGLDVLVEVHDEREAEVALKLGADLIGINNRDLSTFTTDLGVTERVAAMLAGEALVVSESALHSHEDVARVAKAGARSVLIGTAFCSSADVEGKVREVMGW
jgi:indole-3-glycerol phosphate synthase